MVLDHDRLLLRVLKLWIINQKSNNLLLGIINHQYLSCQTIFWHIHSRTHLSKKKIKMLESKRITKLLRLFCRNIQKSMTNKGNKSIQSDNFNFLYFLSIFNINPFNFIAKNIKKTDSFYKIFFSKPNQYLYSIRASSLI